MEKDFDIKEIQKDLNEYFEKKYGRRVQFAGFSPIPQPDERKDAGAEKEEEKKPPSINFDMKPEELKSYLDEYLVKQDEAKEVLATKVCTHFNRIKMFESHCKSNLSESIGDIKNNILIMGPTGVGKTFLIKLIAKKLGVPFVKGDATKFSETGYVGKDVEDLVRDLVYEADGDIGLAQYGIIYLDEVDKIAASHTHIGPDVSRAGVQRALLKPMEEADVELRVPHDPVSQMEAIMEYQKTGKRQKKTVNTKYILFIMSGAFYGLEEIIKKRLNRQGIGFRAEIPSKDERYQYLKQVKAEDLIEFGFESEFVGRLPVLTTFEYLEIEDLYNILRNPKSPIVVGKKRDFKAYGIDLQFEDDALRRLAEEAFKEKTGARGLVSAVERVLLKFEHILPSTDIRHLAVTARMVNDPSGELHRLLNNPESQECETLFRKLLEEEEKGLEDHIQKKVAEFKDKYGMVFSLHRIHMITKRTVEERMELDAVVEEVLEVQHIAEEFARGFSNRNEIKILFQEEAIDCLVEKTWSEGIDPVTFLKSSFQNYEHGLKLIKEKTGKERFLIPANCIEDSETYLSGLIREIYSD